MKFSHFTQLAVGAVAVTAAPTQQLDTRGIDIGDFLDAIANIFPFNVFIEDVCGIITNGEQTLANTFDISTSSDRSGCADVTLVFARGTCDPGNVGALVGPPFIDALGSALGGRSLSVQGVGYAASVDGYLDQDPAGGQIMAGLITDAQNACPNSKIVLGGYSQGGYVVHNAAKDIGDAMSKVSAVVIFGDPLSAEPVAGIDGGRVSIVCHAGDDICSQGDLITLAHLTYAADATNAANFVVSHL